jgi:hypothetical protein
MERKYYKSKWKREDLDEKTVQFTLTAPTFWVEGVGVFRIHVDGELISVDIVVSHPREGYDNIYHLFLAELADRVEPHPDRSVADFRLLQ